MPIRVIILHQVAINMIGTKLQLIYLLIPVLVCGSILSSNAQEIDPRDMAPDVLISGSLSPGDVYITFDEFVGTGDPIMGSTLTVTVSANAIGTSADSHLPK